MWLPWHPNQVENAYVINLGDMLGRWTAHRFKRWAQHSIRFLTCPSLVFLEDFVTDKLSETGRVQNGLTDIDSIVESWLKSHPLKELAVNALTDRLICDLMCRTPCYNSQVKRKDFPEKHFLQGFPIQTKSDCRMLLCWRNLNNEQRIVKMNAAFCHPPKVSCF